MNSNNYDTTVATIAGTLLSSMLSGLGRPTWDGTITPNDVDKASWAVAMARVIVAETRRTE